MHVPEDTLVLHRYGETTPDEAGQIEEHLAICPRCRAVRDDLAALATLLDREPVPEPDAGFNDRTWAAVARAVRLSSAQPSESAWFRYRWIAAGALAAGVAALVFGAASRRPPETTAEPVPTVGATAAGQRVLHAAFDEHLDQAEVLLVELMNAHDTSTDALEFERVTADDLLSTGRLYRLSAEQQGEWRIARMLDALEPVFVEVARSPEMDTAEHVERLQARIDDRALLFEVRALRTSLREGP